MRFQPSILAFLLVLTACSSQTVTSSDLFQKKLDCSNKIESIKSELTKMKKENGNSIVGDYTLDEVFYSESLNTCAYGYFYREELCGLNYGCSKPEDYEYQNVYVIRDVLASKDLYNERYSQPSNNDIAKFRDKIAELKK